MHVTTARTFVYVRQFRHIEPNLGLGISSLEPLVAMASPESRFGNYQENDLEWPDIVIIAVYMAGILAAGIGVSDISWRIRKVWIREICIFLCRLTSLFFLWIGVIETACMMTIYDVI